MSYKFTLKNEQCKKVFVMGRKNEKLANRIVVVFIVSWSNKLTTCYLTINEF